ncbi:MAG: outer membrane beta-barrel protein [Bacteroidetes bacterium]|nr:outer membrane beta-barrel protein [Bacteroidota bacterium]
MYLRKYKLILLFLILLFSKTFVSAQYVYPLRDGWGMGANFGLTYFYGDINDNKGRIWNNTPLSGFYYDDKKGMLSLSLTKKITKIWGLRGNLTYGKLKGTNEYINSYFTATLFAGDMDITFQFLDYFMARSESCKFKYYLFGGLGLTSFASIRNDLLTNAFQNAQGYSSKGEFLNYTTESFGRIGLGIAYQFDKKWQVNFETSLNYINTDDLDAFRSKSVPLEGYGFMSFGLVYKFDLHLFKRNEMSMRSSGDNNRTHNSGLVNKKKKSLHNKWKD